MYTIRRIMRRWPIALLSAFGAPLLSFAQSTPAPAAPATPNADPPEDEAIVLSPFEVDASDDIGYYAPNTLAGSRLNTNLSDLAASITVVTKQQLVDTGSIDINDVFLYEANTEGAATYTPVSINRNAIPDRIAGYSGDDGTPFGAATANRVRGLGAVDTAQNNYPTISRIPFDTYNTNSVEINRGPNSMLFGTGSAAGIVNQSTSEAVLNQWHTTITGRYGSYDAYRGSIGTNIPIGDKLAVYLAALYDSRGFQRKPSADIYKRQYATLTFQPFEKTKITASFEHYDNFNNRPNYQTAADYVTPWLQAGRPGWDPVTQTITFQDTGVTTPAYLISTLDDRYISDAVSPVGNGDLTNTTSPFFVPGINFNGRNSMYIDQGRLVSFWAATATAGGREPDLPASADRTQEQWLIASRRLTQSRGFISPIPDPSTGATGYQTWAEQGITDQSIYDWEHYNIQGANYGTQEAKTYNIEFQQQILPNLNFSAGWFRQELDQWDHYGLGQANQAARVYVDTNLKLLNGEPNPYFGSPYVLDWQADTFFRPETNDNLRAMLAYGLDFRRNDNWTRFLGRHRFLGLASRQKQWANNLRYRLSSQGGDPRFLPSQASDGRPFSWAANGANIQRIYYLGQNEFGVVQRGIDKFGDPGFGAPDHATLNFYDWERGEFNTTEISQGVNLFYAGANYGVTTRNTDSLSFAWQAWLWDDRIVPTIGWRRDELEFQQYDGRTADGSRALETEDLYDHGFGIPGFWNNLGEVVPVAGETMTKGVVIHPFRGWSSIENAANDGNFFADLLRGLSFHYNESDNFNPPPKVYVDYFNNRLPPPSGEGKDYGVGVSLFENRLVFRLNWYESTNENAPAEAAGTAIERTRRIDYSAGKAWATVVTRIRHGEDPADENFNNNEVNPLTPEMEQEISDLQWGDFEFGDFDWPSSDQYAGSINGTESNISKGMEFQMIFNPKRNWNIKLTVGKQKASYSKSVGELQAWLAYRKPIWESLAAPDLPDEYTLFNGNKLYVGQFWSSYGYTGDARSDENGALSTPSSTYSGIVESQLFPLIALEGKSSPSLREWSSSLITNYAFQEGRLKGFAIGGSLRWQDKAVAGYYGLLDPTTYTHPNEDESLITFPDLNRPIYVPSETNVDLWASYTTRIMEDKVRMKIQINLRDAFEDGGLEPIRFQMDGSPAAYRIKDPRQWFVTTTFDF